MAVLSPSNFEILVTIFALNRLGYAIFFLSTRLGPEAYARLLDLANCDTIITPDSLTSTVLEISPHRPDVRRVPFIQRQDYRGCNRATPFQRAGVDPVKESNKLAWILHSSGSTGFPKPIFITNSQCLANFRKSFGLRGFCTSPLFHSHGLMETFRAFYTRSTFYLGNYAFPITYENLMQALEVAKPELVAAVPYVLKLLAEKPEGIEMLSRCRIVLFGGSSCPEELGNRLVAGGVNLVGNYGATETGRIMTSYRLPGDNEWQYMRLHEPEARDTLMDEIAPGVFECVALEPMPSRGTINSKPPYSETNPQGSFRTSDLFTRHPDPEKSNCYKYLSRLDDRITLVNGEKVLPIPMENRIRHEDVVREAAVFGFERSVPGVIIFRSTEHGTDLTAEKYMEMVWPAVEAANAQAETFSRIPKELVIIKGADVMYPRTDKGTFIRAQLYQQFAADISQAYEQFNADASSSGGLSLNIEQLEEWLLCKFRNNLAIPLPSVDTDIFSAGVDSLQTMRIWRSIKKDLDLGPGSSDLSQNIVFEKGTVKALANYLYSLRTGDQVEDEEDEIGVMQNLIEKYSTFTHHFPVVDQQPKGEVVIVTGGTGNLGAFIISELLQRPSVTEVWALVRAPGQASAGARVMQALASRKIKLSEDQLFKLKAIPSDFSKANLGLETQEIEHLLANLTTVIHSAWAVNFNLGVHSFEYQHIRGTYNLLNFCLRSKLPTPARLFFCSSISTAAGTPKPATIRESMIEDLNNAQSMGYGRSKLVTEHIVRNAMRSTAMHARVLRIGQLSGDTCNAIWNDTEAIALMMRSALTTGCLPALSEKVSWLPVDTCARAVTDIAMRSSGNLADSSSTGDSDLVYHLLNPQTFEWKRDLLPALQQRSNLPRFDVVSPAEWLERLEGSEQDPQKNPSIKLLDFWKGKYAGVKDGAAKAIASDGEPSGLTFETTRTVTDCPVLGKVRDPVSAGLVARYVDVWIRSWTS